MSWEKIERREKNKVESLYVEIEDEKKKEKMEIDCTAERKRGKRMKRGQEEGGEESVVVF